MKKWIVWIIVIVIFVILLIIMGQPHDPHILTLDNPAIPNNEKAQFVATVKIEELGHKIDDYEVSTESTDDLWIVSFSPKKISNEKVQLYVKINDDFDVIDIQGEKE